MKKKKNVFGFVFYFILSFICMGEGFYLGHVSDELVFSVLYYIVALLFAIVAGEYLNGGL